MVKKQPNNRHCSGCGIAIRYEQVGAAPAGYRHPYVERLQQVTCPLRYVIPDIIINLYQMMNNDNTSSQRHLWPIHSKVVKELGDITLNRGPFNSFGEFAEVVTSVRRYTRFTGEWHSMKSNPGGVRRWPD